MIDETKCFTCACEYNHRPGYPNCAVCHEKLIKCSEVRRKYNQTYRDKAKRKKNDK